MKSDDFFDKLMENPEYREEYEKMEPETEAVKAQLRQRRDLNSLEKQKNNLAKA